VGTIEEGRKVSFRAPSPSPPSSPQPAPVPAKGIAFPTTPSISIEEQEKEKGKKPDLIPDRARSPGMEEEGSASAIIGKASAVVNELRAVPSRDDEWRERLDQIDARQQRIERMLAKLVGEGDSDVFSTKNPRD
jgi:hypothetical protein